VKHFHEFAKRRLANRTPPSRQRRLVPRTADGVYLIDDQKRRLLNFGSNDYLGLAMQPGPDLPPETEDGDLTLRGSTASSLVCGWSQDHQALADAIADWEGTESAVLFPSGYAACCGTIATLAEADDLILSDQLNHASLIDGCRLSKATTAVYRHLDVQHAREILEAHRTAHAEAWIVTDSIFSMDGDVAPLIQLSELACEFGAHLVVDEAHGSGVFGHSGTGICESIGVKEHVFLRIGTLSKAMGSQGGFVAGSTAIVEHLVNHCRMLLFSTALSRPAVQDASRALRHVRHHHERREHVRNLAKWFRSEYSGGFDSIAKEPHSASQVLGIRDEVPIIPILLGDDDGATQASAELLEQGFFVPAIRPPTVPEGTSRLRVSLSAAHTKAQVTELLKALHRIVGRASNENSFSQ